MISFPKLLSFPFPPVATFNLNLPTASIIKKHLHFFTIQPEIERVFFHIIKLFHRFGDRKILKKFSLQKKSIIESKNFL